MFRYAPDNSMLLSFFELAAKLLNATNHAYINRQITHLKSLQRVTNPTQTIQDEISRLRTEIKAAVAELPDLKNRLELHNQQLTLISQSINKSLQGPTATRASAYHIAFQNAECNLLELLRLIHNYKSNKLQDSDTQVVQRLLGLLDDKNGIEYPLIKVINYFIVIFLLIMRQGDTPPDPALKLEHNVWTATHILKHIYNLRRKLRHFTLSTEECEALPHITYTHLDQIMFCARLFLEDVAPTAGNQAEQACYLFNKLLVSKLLSNRNALVEHATKWAYPACQHVSVQLMRVDAVAKRLNLDLFPDYRLRLSHYVTNFTEPENIPVLSTLINQNLTILEFINVVQQVQKRLESATEIYSTFLISPPSDKSKKHLIHRVENIYFDLLVLSEQLESLLPTDKMITVLNQKFKLFIRLTEVLLYDLDVPYKDTLTLSIISFEVAQIDFQTLDSFALSCLISNAFRRSTLLMLGLFPDSNCDKVARLTATIEARAILDELRTLFAHIGPTSLENLGLLTQLLGEIYLTHLILCRNPEESNILMNNGLANDISLLLEKSPYNKFYAFVHSYIVVMQNKKYLHEIETDIENFIMALLNFTDDPDEYLRSIKTFASISDIDFLLLGQQAFMQLNPAKIQINPVLLGYFFSVLKELIMRNLDNPAAINNDDLAITKLWDQINAYHMDMHLHLADLFEKLSPIYNGMLPLSLTEPLPAKAASKPVKATVKLSEEDKQKNAASFLPKDSPKSGKKAPSQKASEKKKAAALASEKRAENPVEKPRVFVTDSFTKVKKHFTEGKTVNIEELIKFYYRSLKNKRNASVREQLHAVMGLSRCLELMDTQQRQQVIKDLKAKASIIFASDLLSAEEKALEKNFKIAIERHCTTETKAAGQDAKQPGKQPAPAKPVAPKQPAKQLVTKEKSNTKEKPKTTTKNSATFFKQAPAKPHVSNAPTKELARAPQVTAFKSIETLEVVVTAPALTTTTTLPPAPPCTVPTIPMTVMLQPVMLMPIFPVPVIPIPSPPIDHAIFTRMNLNIHLDDIEKSVMNALRSNNLLPLIHGGAVIDTIYGKKPRDIDMLCFSSIQNLQMIIRNIDLPDIQVIFRADKNNVLHIDFQAFNNEMAHARTIHSLDIICLQGTTFEERMLSLKALANGFPVNWTLYYDYFEKMLLDPVHQKFKIFGKILDFTHDDIDLQHEAIINPGIIAYIIEKLVRYHNCGVKPSERLVEALLSLNPAYLLNSVIPESRFKKLFLTGRAMDTLKMLQQYKLVSFVFKNIDEALLESECQRLDHELQKDFNYMRSDFQYAQQQVFLQAILYDGFANQITELYNFKKFSNHCSVYLKSQNFYIEENVKLVITLDWWQKLNQAKLQSAEASPEASCAEGSQTVFNSIRRN